MLSACSGSGDCCPLASVLSKSVLWHCSKLSTSATRMRSKLLPTRNAGNSPLDCMPNNGTIGRRNHPGASVSASHTKVMPLPTRKGETLEDKGWYLIGYLITWALTFLGFWIYAISEYGFLLGVGLGWIPSAIAATVVSLFWPLYALLLGGLLLWVLYNLE